MIWMALNHSSISGLVSLVTLAYSTLGFVKNNTVYIALSIFLRVCQVWKIENCKMSKKLYSDIKANSTDFPHLDQASILGHNDPCVRLISGD
jgi:hypothetical protein